MMTAHGLKKSGSVLDQKDVWQLQAAKAQFSELFRRVRSRGPQWITRQGKDSVVVLSSEQFEKLTKGAWRQPSLADFFAKSPLAASGIILDREPDYGRSVDL
jgi:prevent-host-death family protein